VKEKAVMPIKVRVDGRDIEETWKYNI